MPHSIEDVPRLVDATLRYRKTYQLAVPAAGALVLLGFLVFRQNGAPLIHALAPGLILGTVAALFAWIVLGQILKRRMSAQIMPILCKAAGEFHYAVSGSKIAELTSSGLLPRGELSRNEDHITGTFAGVGFGVRDVEIETRSGEGGTTKFSGLVVEAEVGLPTGFLVRRDRQGLGGWLRDTIDGALLGKERQADISVAGDSFEIWSADPEAGQRAAGAVAAVLPSLPPGMAFLSAYQTESRAYIAIELEDTLDAFHIGGLFTPRDAITRNIEQALTDLQYPPKIALAWASALTKA